MGTPSHHPNFHGIFHLINQPQNGYSDTPMVSQPDCLGKYHVNTMSIEQHSNKILALKDFHITNPSRPRRKSLRLCASSPSAKRCLVASGGPSPKERRRKVTTGKHCLQRAKSCFETRQGKMEVLPGKNGDLTALPSKIGILPRQNDIG